ncbi:MAG: hypothetical protein WD534_06905 [Phycisphaeraceae bacterium]
MVATLTFTCRPFSFTHLVLSHGWVHLAPFTWDGEHGTLDRALRGGSRLFHVVIRCRQRHGNSLVVARVSPTPSPAERQQLRQQVRRILRLNEDFSAFHALCRQEHDLRFVAEQRCGGMLRGPTAFEDLIKTLCTVNCDWRNTKNMCQRLCAVHQGAFPSPTDILRMGKKGLRTQARVGFRAEPILTIARLTHAGKLPLDAWAAAGDYEQIAAALRAVRGIGDYCIHHMLVLLGCYRHIPVDSEVTRYLRATADAREANVKLAEVVQRFDRFGDYAFLAYKFGRIGRRNNFTNK